MPHPPPMALPRSHNCTIRGSAPSDSHTPRNCSRPSDQPLSSRRGYLAATPMSLLPPDRAVRALLHRKAPQLSVEKIEAIPSARVQQLYIIHITNSKPLLLTLAPSTDVRPLRCERESIGTEVAVLSWLGPWQLDESKAGPSDGQTKSPTTSYHQRRPTITAQCGSLITASPPSKNYLQGFIPKITEHGLPQPDISSSKLFLSEPCPGTTVSTLERPLSSSERQSISFQAGQLFRRIACHVSPTGSFGYAIDVLTCNPQAQITMSHDSSSTPPSEIGYPAWSQAFHLLLESVLRDLEDMYVQVAYGQVRAHFARLRPVFDRVKRPSLVAIEAGESINLLVSSPGEEAGHRHPVPGESGKEARWAAAADQNATGYPTVERIQGAFEEVKVTGLRDWSNCIFGDPLIAITFANNPSQDFLDGLKTPICGSDPFGDAGVIEDSAHSPERLALYECYHSLCGIAHQYYRPRDPEVDIELYWRKRLQDSLATLSKLEKEEAGPQESIKRETPPARRA